MTRVAVQLGRAWLRVAVDDPRPRLLAALPVRDADPRDVLDTALTALLDRPVEELLVVHTRGRPPAVPPRVAAAVRVVPAALAALYGTPAEAGAAGAAAAGSPACDAEADGATVLGGLLDGPVEAVVVDVGHSGTEIARVRGGRVVVACRLPVGGAVLDDATAALLGTGSRCAVAPAAGAASASTGRGAAAGSGDRTVSGAELRAARETLSLQPVVQVGVPPVELHAEALRRALARHLAAVVDGVRIVRDGAGPGRSPPILLVGGVARTPLLSELLDAAGVADVHVGIRPDSAAVVGALRLPPDLLGPPLVRSGTGRTRASVPSSVPSPGRWSATSWVPSRAGLPARSSEPSPSLVPSPGPASVASATTPSVPRDGSPAAFWLPPVPQPRRRPLRGVAVTAAAAVALSGLYAAGAALPAPGPVPLAAAGELVQYGYAVRLPAGWAHTGGLPERRRSLLTPVGAPDGGNLITVEGSPLGYDADTEPQRARAELRAEFGRAAADGAPLSEFDDDARFAGRPVVAYREAAGGPARGADAAQIDWYVVLDGEAQLSVGCRQTGAGAAAVAAACATVVASLRRTT